MPHVRPALAHVTTTTDVVTVLPGTRRMARRMPMPSSGAMDFEDMEQDAALGVLDAARTYDRRRGTSFATHAYLRARGAVLDGQRAMDHVPRSWRQAQRNVVRARTALVAELGRLPQPDELAERLGISTQELRDVEGRCRIPGTLHEPLPGQQSEGEPLTVADAITDDQLLPEENAEAREEAARLHAAISLLPAREEFLIRTTWFNGMMLTSVAELLGVSPSRASQIRTAAMRRLPELMRQVESDACRLRAA
jgi:RNA polymerase sigma factor for flagellar operon FliA